MCMWVTCNFLSFLSSFNSFVVIIIQEDLEYPTSVPVCHQVCGTDVGYSSCISYRRHRIRYKVQKCVVISISFLCFFTSILICKGFYRKKFSPIVWCILYLCVKCLLQCMYAYTCQNQLVYHHSYCGVMNSSNNNCNCNLTQATT